MAKDKIGLEDGGNLLLETNEIGPSGLGSADKLSLEEMTSEYQLYEITLFLKHRQQMGKQFQLLMFGDINS